MQPPLSTRDANRSYLLSRFVGRLLDLGPRTALDVGCGGGDVLRMGAQQGVEVRGIDGKGPRLAELAQRGFDVRAGRAEELPFEDDSVDLVVMRHVPHHLDDPPLAVREAVRVARRGVLLAEPWYDRELPSQLAGYALDQWLRARDRAAGMVHGSGFGPRELAEMVWTAAPGASIELETHLRPSCEAPEELRPQVDRRLEGVLDGDPARAELEGLWAAGLEHGFGLGGSAFAVALL